MSAPDDTEPALISTRPYLIRALYEWCADNGLTPYLAVRVDDTVQVPRDYVRGGEIVLNISADATSALELDNDYIRFKARFGGTARQIIVPVDRVMAIYARENGQGMAFAVPEASAADPGAATGDAVAPPSGAAQAPRGSRLTVADAPSAPVGKEFPAAPGGRSDIHLVSTTTPDAADGDDGSPPPTPPRPRPALKRVK